MLSFEERITRVALFGRFADGFTRQTVLPGDYRISLDNSDVKPVYKSDGYFSFVGLKPRPTAYGLNIRSQIYRQRNLSANLTTLDALELVRKGEDELYVTIKSIVPGQKRVNFNAIPFLPSIQSGVKVYGEGGFEQTLQKTIEGEDVDFAILSDVTGLSNGKVLRFVRSGRILLYAGPYYEFEEPATVLSVRISDNTPEKTPIAGAEVTLKKINATALTTVVVGGLELFRVQLSGESEILGPVNDIKTFTNTRGEALLNFSAHLSITSVEIEFKHPAYVSSTQTITVVAGEKTRATIQLVPM